MFKDKEDCVAKLLELEKDCDETQELLDKQIEATYKVVEENKELNKELGKVEGKLADLTSEYYELENLKNNEIDYLSEQIQKLKIELDTPESIVFDKLDEAKELIRNLLGVTYGEGWNYSLDVKVKAEQFLDVKNFKECE